MIGTVQVVSSFAVDDLSAAAAFYRETVGLRVSEDDRGALWLLIDGDHGVLVYPRPDHTPATFTVLNFFVDDIALAVDDLVARGTQIQRYDGFTTDDKGIHHTKHRSIAWFTDPAGNILSVAQETLTPGTPSGA